jgi:3-dehydroquinate dehydratase-2
MLRILVLNGPNLNLLGERDHSVYGSETLDDVNARLAVRARELGTQVVFFQSNHEGALIDRIHAERRTSQGLIMNPGALTHYSYSLRDAVEAAGLPLVEVHISDWKTVMGKGTGGYIEALESLVQHLSE